VIFNAGHRFTVTSHFVWGIWLRYLKANVASNNLAKQRQKTDRVHLNTKKPVESPFRAF